MKARQRNPVALLGVAVLSIGTMSLLSVAGLSRFPESLEMVFVTSQALSVAATVGMLYRWTGQKGRPQPQYVRVRV